MPVHYVVLLRDEGWFSFFGRAALGIAFFVFGLLPVGLGLQFPHRPALVAVLAGAGWIVLGFMDAAHRRMGAITVLLYTAAGLAFVYAARWGAITSDLQAEDKYDDVLRAFGPVPAGTNNVEAWIDDRIRAGYQVGVATTAALGGVAAVLAEAAKRRAAPGTS